MPKRLAGTAEEIHLTRLPGQSQGLGVHVGQGQNLAGAPVLNDARDQAALVECDFGVVHRLQFRDAGTQGRPEPRTSPLGIWTISNQYWVQVRITSTRAPKVTGLVMNELTPRS